MIRSLRSERLRGLVFATILSTVLPLSAEEPLHVRIDELIDSTNPVAPTQSVGDAEFLRRVSIDLTGMPPETSETRAYLADTNPAKRVVKIDKLLASHRFVRHLTDTIDVMLMERRRSAIIKPDEWYGYLLESVRQNKPWNQLAQEIMAADGVDPKLRPAARFYLDRASEPNLITRDVGRMFFGRDVQCAQCHDHPIIDDYKQTDYHGIYAFLSGGYAFTAPDKKVYYAEKTGSEEKFVSVFFPDTQKDIAPKLIFQPEIDEPKLYPGDEYKVKPDKTVRPVVKFSRRQKMAELATDGTNRAFNENIANRLWAMVMGRGLVHPVDLHHSGNPPSHPELLKLLGEEIAKMNFDTKAFLRELVLTETYRRSIDLPSDLTERSAIAETKVTELESLAQTLEAQAAQLTEAHDKAYEAWSSAKTEADPIEKELAEARTKSAASYKKYSAVENAMNAAKAKLQPKLDLAATYSAVTTQADETLKTLGEDAELNAAILIYRKRLAATQAEMVLLQKAVDAQVAAIKKPTEELEASRKVIDETLARLAPHEKTIHEKQVALIAARETMLDAWTQANRTTEQATSVGEFTTYKTLSEESLTSAKTYEQAKQTAQAARTASDEYASLFQQQQQSWQAINSEFEKVSSQRASVVNEIETIGPAVKNLTESHQQAIAAMAILESETELAQFVAVLETKRETYQGKLDSAQKSKTEMDTVMSTLGPKHTQAKTAFEEAESEMTKRLAATNTAAAAMNQALSKANAARDAANAVVQKVSTRWSNQFTVAPLKPLTPEQLAWSMLQVTGVRERYETAARQELDKKEPLSDEAKQDPAQLAARETKVEQAVYDKLKGNVAAFAKIYGAGDGQPQYDFFATVDQALFASNAGSIIGWVQPSGNNVTARMIKETDLAKAADDLYLTYLTRHPTSEESKAIVDYLNSRPKEKAACVAEIAWALLTSAEFRFNH